MKALVGLAIFLMSSSSFAGGVTSFLCSKDGILADFYLLDFTNPPTIEMRAPGYPLYNFRVMSQNDVVLPNLRLVRYVDESPYETETGEVVTATRSISFMVGSKRASDNKSPASLQMTWVAHVQGDPIFDVRVFQCTEVP